MRGINRYIEDLVRSRRPRRFRASDDEAAMARAAITLRSARPGSGEPAEEFVTALHKRLADELDPPPARRSVAGRRTFLSAAATAGAVAAGAAGAAIDHVLTTSGSGPSPAAAGTLVPGRGIWLTVANSADLPEGAVRPFTVSALTGFVGRAGGQLRAVSGICTHQGCRLAMADRPARLVCPCHGATFALDGTVLTHKFPDPLAALPQIEVREADRTVQVYAPLEP
ncbi:MAG TPA: Rieske (2Fe-2S) protein [Streptosporangiaceae bacterium]|nr:Rieske (2Fe-2S) protein [Streptosporangiaceae bacterium]